MKYILHPSGHVQPEGENLMIPADPSNTDYRQYLAWVDEGNTPTPFEPPAPVVEPVKTAAERLQEAGFDLDELRALLLQQ